MKRQHHTKNCPCRQESWLGKYANHDFDECTCDAFANNESRLMQGGTMNESTFFFKGDLAKYTGKTEKLYGQIWLEAEILEGHREGDLVLTCPVKTSIDDRPVYENEFNVFCQSR